MNEELRRAAKAASDAREERRLAEKLEKEARRNLDTAISAQVESGQLKFPGEETQPTHEEVRMLVAVLKEGMMVLVREGVITEARAEERARNQAMAVIGVFEIRAVDP